jgi:uncharacterized protein YndB with AHSA1/START domain
MTDRGSVTEPASLSLEPVVTKVEVPVPPERAFDLFVADFGRWWPLATHSIAADEELAVQAVDARIEQRAGGPITEVWSNGETVSWGSVLAWEPPRRLVLAWNPSRTRSVSTEVEITFVASALGTLVRLEHRGWEALGDRAESLRTSYRMGWPVVLGRYAGISRTSSPG